MRTRLIERWLPIAEIGEESMRERRSMTALPPIYYLHVWWARRPLVASRAAILASLLPAEVDRKKVLHVLGIHGDPVGARRKMDNAKRTGVRIKDPYGYRRAFTYTPSEADKSWFEQHGVSPSCLLLDPTAGGGSIPFEAVRLGLTTLANDLNPVPALIERATIEWPLRYGIALRKEYLNLSLRWRALVEERLSTSFPQTRAPTQVDITYLWARTVTCPYCAGLIPLSPNWRLAPGGKGIRLLPQSLKRNVTDGRICHFEIVSRLTDHSPGSIANGDATCPFSDCGRVVDGDEVKRQAVAGHMGEQLFAIVFKRRVLKKTKTGKEREKWERGFRAPGPEDDIDVIVRAKLDAEMAAWEALDLVPSEAIPDGSKTSEALRYGMKQWRDMFNARQLLGHSIAVEAFHELLADDERAAALSQLRRVAYTYLALSLDKLRDYNSRMARWHSKRQVVVNTFDRHDFAFKWSYAEMAVLVPGLGFDWAIKQTAKCIGELCVLLAPNIDQAPVGAEGHGLFAAERATQGTIRITCRSADDLGHLSDRSVDVIVIDPPYEANVMYAELADFFYVWLKRTAGQIHPELFTGILTDKERDAVANVARFAGLKGAKTRAIADYRDRMAAIFTECRRVLKDDGIMTLMFTHKATGAWDALTSGLLDAGFAITASWPINTEAEGSLHIKDKSAANSTIFLVCRPRAQVQENAPVTYWEDVEPGVARAVRNRVQEFQAAGIRGVDLYLAAFGPALEEFSKHWPLRRGTPRPDTPAARRRRKAQTDVFDLPVDPYAVGPEDALDAARREVKRWRLEQLTHLRRNVELDPLTSFFVLAWDAFEAPEFPFDEALRLARAVGVDLDTQVIGHLAAKQKSNVLLWDSATRAAKSTLGSPDGSIGMIDALHHAANAARIRGLDAAKEIVEKAGIAAQPAFLVAMEAVLEVLPPSRQFTGVELHGAAAAAASDFELLEGLRRLAFSDKVGEPQQLSLWREV